MAMLLLIIMPVFALTLPAQVQAQPDFWGEDTDITGTIGLGEKDPRDIAAGVINVILGFLGIIAVVIILLGGFKWMTAGGNEDKVAEARNLILAGIVGLVIILAAFAIATFVVSNIYEATI